MRKRLTKQDCVELRVRISNLGYGQAEAESRSLFARRPPEERPGRLVDYLVELGVFRNRPGDRIDVPDLYLRGLDLRRKGGVSRRAAVS